MRGRLPGAVWALAGGKVVLHLATVRLSFHRDELYFIAASKRLAASYVDFQPVTPVLVRGARLLFGETVFGLRVIPALAGAAVVILGAAIALRLGGDRRAQVFAAFACLVVPLFVGMDTAVNTVSLETPAFMLVALFFARLIRTADERWWIAIGAAIGLALLIKFTVLGYLAGLAVALVVTPMRAYLRSRWLWLGALLAIVMVAPSIIWQLNHGLPVLEFVSNQGGGGAVLGLRGRLGYLVSLVVLPGPFALFLIVPGVALLLQRTNLLRPVGIAVAAALVIFLIASGKGYYAAPGLAVLLSAGAIAVSGWSQRARRLLVAGLIVNLLIPLSLVLPVVPISVLRDNPDLADATELGERLGWDDLAASTARVLGSVEADERDRAIVIADNYALSAAIEYYAERYRLPAAVSGHNSAYLWWPRIEADHVAVSLGFEERELQRWYEEVECVAKITNTERVDNYEYGKPICVARQLRVSPAELRERMKMFTA